MKRIYTIMTLLLCLSVSMQAQNYVIANSTGTEAPFDYNSGGTTVLPIPSTEVLSSWQTLPFPFTFFGQAVTGYKVSDNGYITFDNAATTSYNSNTSIPAVGGPNNAIYAFWDDVNVVSGSGSPDVVSKWTYGTTPNRVHVIQWYSVTPVSGTGFLYCTIRLYECGDFDVVNGYGNATGMSGTVGCENAAGTVGVQVSGSPAMSYPSVGVAPNDDIVYTFISTDVGYDVAVKTVDFNSIVTIGNNTVTGTLQNLGGTTITSLDLNYTVNGGAAVTDNLTGLNIAPGAIYNYSHGTPWNVATGGQNLALCVFADNINGNVDARTCNDQICVDLFSNLGVSGNKKVLIEEFTGAWCGWCPDGAVVLENVLTANPGNVFVASIHSGDQMTFNDGIDAGFGVSAYPNAMVDRYVFAGEPDEPHSRGAWAANTATRLTAYTPAEISISNNSWFPSSRTISFTAQVNFVDYAAGDLRIVAYVVEDNVTGSGTGYDQVNYLNTQAGHTYYNAGDPIVGFNHRHVLRAVPAGAMGNAGVIPANVSPASTYSETFTYTLPANYDENEVSLIVALALNSNTIGERYVYNSWGEDLDLSLVSLKDPMAGNSIKVFPNPNAGTSMMELNFAEPTSASIAVYDTYGRQVMQLAEREFGATNSRIPLDMSGLANGMYYVTVKTEAGTMKEKVMLAR